jgi:hypothetical protein
MSSSYDPHGKSLDDRVLETFWHMLQIPSSEHIVLFFIPHCEDFHLFYIFHAVNPSLDKHLVDGQVVDSLYQSKYQGLEGCRGL